MNLRAKILVFLYLFFFVTSSLLGSPIVGSSAKTLKSRNFMFEGHFSYYSYTSRYDVGSEEWIDFPSEDSYVVIGFLPQFYYGILDYLTVRLTLPVSMKNRDYGTSQKSTGIGDIIFDLKHRLIEGGGGIPIVSWYAGIRLPTGDKETDPQLGDGSIDGVIGILLTEEVSPITAHLKTGYWYNGKVDENDIADKFYYNGAVEYSLPYQCALVGELDGFITGTGLEQKYQLAIAPGITNKSFHGLVLEASVIIPLATRGGLLYSYSPYIGFMYSF